MKGHDDESARRICGEMQQKIEGGSSDKTRREAAIIKTPNNAISYQDKNRDKVYLKVFLIDGSVNKNQWGVRPDSIIRNIYSAIGKPVVLYRNTGKEPDASQRVVGEYDHPYLGGSDSVHHALAYQDLFRVATYIDVFESSTNPGQWYGVAEVTDDGVKRAIREDPDLPMYVSPTIQLLNAANEPENAHAQWTFMHSAIVDRPAFGIDKAYIGGQCSGQRDTCLLQLRKAAIAANENNEVGCGFCTYKATKEIQLRIRQASSPSSSKQTSVSSFDKFSEKLETRQYIMSNDNNQGNDSNNNKDQNQQEQNKDTQQQSQQDLEQQLKQPEQRQQNQQTVEQQQQESKTTVTKKDNNNTNNNTNNKNASASELLDTVQRLAAENRNLQLQLQTAKSDVDTHKQINTQYETRLASLEKHIEQERASLRTQQISSYVNNAPAYRLLSDQERAKQVENFVKGSMSIEEIQNIVEPLNASVAKQFQYPNRSASARGPARLSLGGNTGKTIEVRTATASAEKSEDEVPFYLQVSDMLAANNNGGRA